MFSLIAIGIKLGLAFFKRDSSFFFTRLPDILPKKVMKYSHVDFLSTSLKVDPMSDSTGLSNLEGFYPKAKGDPKTNKAYILVYLLYTRTRYHLRCNKMEKVHWLQW